MCDDTIWEDPYSLLFVPHWFLTQQQLEIRHNNDEHCTVDEIIGWYKRYKKRKVQKAK